jgi:hypothetical protein
VCDDVRAKGAVQALVRRVDRSAQERRRVVASELGDPEDRSEPLVVQGRVGGVVDVEAGDEDTLAVARRTRPAGRLVDAGARALIPGRPRRRVGKGTAPSVSWRRSCLPAHPGG